MRIFDWCAGCKNNFMELTLQSLSEQVITDQIQAILLLEEKCLIYEIEFYCKETNDDTGIWEEDVYRKYHTVLLKSSIIGYSISRNHKEDRYYISIRTTYTVVEHYCKSESEAIDITDQIKKWILL